jgi:predicted extracellular nuclease
LVEAIEGAGGAAYEVFQIDPEDGQDGGRPGANIRVGFLVRGDRVEAIRRGSAGPREETELQADEEGRPRLSLSPGRLLDESFAGPPAGDGTRKPLALEVLFRGHRLLLVVNHLSSKGGDDRLFGSRQPPVAVTEDRRNLQARRLRLFVEEAVALDPDARVVVLGDLNEHEFRSPLAILTGGGLLNLTERAPVEERYSFIFQGSSQLLDHILVTPALSEGAEVAILHLNSHLPASQAASDHDPVVVRLRVP